MRFPRNGAVGLAITVLMSLLGMGSASAATPFSFAVIGDIPYGSSQLAALPGRIDQINADPWVQLVSHLGDISSPLNCSDGYFSTIRSDFDRVADPLVYTPGDNEWADCHRAGVGRADPLNRLAAVRRVFFPTAGQTLGKTKAAVTYQPDFRENVILDRAAVTLASVHLVGSYNDLAPWTGLGFSQPTPAQSSEVTARTKAASAQISKAFATAKAHNSRAVVLLTQADMFAGTNSTYRTAFKTVVQTVAKESVAFGRPVVLFNGDSHNFTSDKPLTATKWLSFYGITTSVPNLSRITIEGGSAVDEWIKVTVVTGASVLQIQRVAFK